MVIRDIADLLGGHVLVGHEYLERDVKAAFGSDLMSDVLAYVGDETVLLTGLTNHQVVRTAEMLDLKAIIFVRGKCPPEDVVTLAKEQGIVLIATSHTLYTASGILYCNGLQGISK
ncbi:DRTGG domain-containing protein [Fusibacter sp. JL216-2]|uniref:DRTGG domain-containing protein n=1 Tax=Fusibacter sp. JL216-2 TaxID=3071453 RepID=UPI003D341578